MVEALVSRILVVIPDETTGGKYIIGVTGEALAAVKEIADRGHETYGQALARSIATEKVVYTTRARGGHVIVEHKGLELTG